MELAEAKQQQIIAMEKSLAATKHHLDLVTCQNEWRSVFDRYCNQRIQLMIELGELPRSISKKKSTSLSAQWRDTISK